MSRLAFVCPYCSAPIHPTPEQLGLQVACPACGAAVSLPPPSTASQVPQAALKECRFCGEAIRASAVKCKFCGEWLEEGHRPAQGPQGRGEIKVIPPWQVLVFVVVTLGIYQLFWIYQVFKDLHAKRATETTPGQALGYCFIPFFNFVWYFMIWAKFAKAVDTLYRSANADPPATGVVWIAPPALIVAVILNFAVPPVGSILWLVALGIVLPLAQSWMNTLATLAPADGEDGPIMSAGGVLSPRCPECAQPIRPGARRCLRCNHALSEEEQAAVKKEAEANAAKAEKQRKLTSFKTKSIVMRIIAWPLVAFSALFLVSTVCMLFDPSARSEIGIAGIVMACLIMGGIPGAIAGILLWRAGVNSKEWKRLKEEAAVEAVPDKGPAALPPAGSGDAVDSAPEPSADGGEEAGIRFECSQCGQRLSAEKGMSGQEVVCPECEATVVVP